MKFNFFDILKQMFGNKTEEVNKTDSQTVQSSYHTNDEKYRTNPFDLLIIAGDSSLILTSDRRLGGLWNYIDFSPCSGSTSDCLAEMRTLLADSLDEAFDAVLFPLDEEKSFLLNMADCINRSACDEDSEFYKKHIDDKLDIFYPIIKMFAEKNSPSKVIGIMIYYGGGTGIGLSHLAELFANDGFRCYIEGTKSPLLKKEYQSEVLVRKAKGYYEEFDKLPFVDPKMSIQEFYDTVEKQRLSQMKNRLRERINNEIQTKEDKKINNCTSIEQAAVRTYNGVVRPASTPNAISSLKPDEVFVFGSNLEGAHAGGAARAAVSKFGAIWGQGVGLQGQSYAIPTMQGGIKTIKPYVDQFIGFAKEHTELFFYVTRIGCGIAGFKDSDIATSFRDAIGVENICLPESFVKVIDGEMSLYSNSDMVIHYGQVRTMADILIALNEINHFSDSRVAINEVERYIASQNHGHSSISAMAFHIIADVLQSPSAFVNGKLNDSAIKKEFAKPQFHCLWENSLYKYRFAKLWKLVCYFNEFRRYSSPAEIISDLRIVNPNHYFIMTDSAWGAGNSGVGGYPWHFFCLVVNQKWSEFAPNGVLETKLLEDYMFKNHEISLRAIGLEATIQKDFEQDFCWSNVYFPKLIGTAPVYIEKKNGNKRRFIKSCGEGKGPNQDPESLETQYAKQLLIEDCKYEIKGEYDSWSNFIPVYFVPKTDSTLPIYSMQEKLVFEDMKQRQAFMEEELSNLYSPTEHEIEEIKNTFINDIIR